MFDNPFFFLYNTIRVIVRCAMRLNVNRVLHTPDASEDFHFEMDLSDLEFGGEKPVSQPVVVDGRIRNKAGMLLLELQASTTLRCRCSRCLDPLDLPKATDYSCVLAEEKQFEDSDDIVLLDHDEVDPEDLARTAFILDMDTVFLCSPDCKGLCSGCGANLNRESCRCKKQVDPRLAALAKLLPQEDV